MIDVYAFIKDGVVINTLLFDNPETSILDHYTEMYSADTVLLVTGDAKKIINVGCIYDAPRFVVRQPFPSWVLLDIHEQNLDSNVSSKHWNAPVEPKPSLYLQEWSEEALAWIETPILLSELEE